MLRAALLALLLLAAAAPARAGGDAEHQLMFVEKRARFDADGFAAQGETRTFRFVVAQPNVTRVDFVLTWRETGDETRLSRMDVLSLEATDAEGRMVQAPVRGATGELRLTAARVNPLPEPRSVREPDLARALAEAEGTRGVGEWRATVRVEDVGDPQGASVDAGNDFSLAVHLTYYEGVPMRVVTLPGAAAASASPPPAWLGALALLGLASLALAALLARGELRRRRTRLSTGVTTPRPAAGDDPACGGRVTDEG